MGAWVWFLCERENYNVFMMRCFSSTRPKITACVFNTSNADRRERQWLTDGRFKQFWKWQKFLWDNLLHQRTLNRHTLKSLQLSLPLDPRSNLLGHSKWNLLGAVTPFSPRSQAECEFICHRDKISLGHKAKISTSQSRVKSSVLIKRTLIGGVTDTLWHRLPTCQRQWRTPFLWTSSTWSSLCPSSSWPSSPTAPPSATSPRSSTSRSTSLPGSLVKLSLRCQA